MYLKRFISIFLILCLTLSLFAGCAPKKESPQGTNQGSETPITQETGASEQTPIGDICPLTGLPIENSANNGLIPIAVMLDNEVSARPQSGLWAADIVYEMPVEGNITRYMAVFHHAGAPKIGPVRSARPYFIDKALEFNAIYTHCGGSPQALKDIETLKVNAFNDLKGTPCFWRAKDRKAPHNLYTSWEAMRKVSAAQKLENSTAPRYFTFNESFTAPEGNTLNALTITYSKNYKVGYTYDEKSQKYYRTINGAPLKDKDSGQEIATTNILIERVHDQVLDEKGRLALTNIGGDIGYYISGGKMVQIKWEKTSRTGKTVYRDLNGNEIKINKGVTWIQVVPYEIKIDIGA